MGRAGATSITASTRPGNRPSPICHARRGRCPRPDVKADGGMPNLALRPIGKDDYAVMDDGAMRAENDGPTMFARILTTLANRRSRNSLHTVP